MTGVALPGFPQVRALPESSSTLCFTCTKFDICVPSLFSREIQMTKVWDYVHLMSPKKGETGQLLAETQGKTYSSIGEIFCNLKKAQRTSVLEKYTHLHINLVFARDSPGTQLNLPFVMFSGN
ncbi:hypothetical protein CSKR_104983 [Clonorchis sinensis]|uniref:Uncharacterized protein n=1 Tax=Clonorchis sinensis TaxID=79923 RepID=A0A419PEY5_CLOSI|nr:hypothetical protein CSKR_104983 [Clonorchis sinensis]